MVWLSAYCIGQQQQCFWKEKGCRCQWPTTCVDKRDAAPCSLSLANVADVLSIDVHCCMKLCRLWLVTCHAELTLESRQPSTLKILQVALFHGHLFARTLLITSPTIWTTLQSAEHLSIRRMLCSPSHRVNRFHIAGSKHWLAWVQVTLSPFTVSPAFL